MTISPIKSIIRNLTDGKLMVTITSHMRLVLEPKGTKGDSAHIRGDIFTVMERTPVVDALATLLLDGKAELTYAIDKIATVVENTDTANIDSNVSMQERVTDRNKLTTAATPKKEEPKGEEPKKVEPPKEEPKKEETPKAEEPAIKAAEGEEEVKKEEPKKDEAPKPPRKPRQIKAN